MRRGIQVQAICQSGKEIRTVLVEEIYGGEVALLLDAHGKKRRRRAFQLPTQHIVLLLVLFAILPDTCVSYCSGRQVVVQGAGRIDDGSGNEPYRSNLRCTWQFHVCASCTINFRQPFSCITVHCMRRYRRRACRCMHGCVRL